MPSRTRLRSTLAAAAAAATLLTMTACGKDSEGSSSEKAGTAGSAISADRCAANKAAGTITYMSGYYWQASASILEVISADQLGYFEDLCLDVEMQPGPGDTSQNAKLLAAGKVTISPLSEQDVITSNLNGLDITGISSYSNAGLDVLMTTPEITDLTQLKGKNLGHKGWVPMSVSAMLAKAGLEGEAVKQVKVGYDPSILPRGQVDALTAFVSNEPNQLKKAGSEVTVWSPKDFDVPASLGAFAVNPAFAGKHPTAVEDFLRASFKAYTHCADDANVKECIGYQKDLAGAESDSEHETEVWTTETAVVADNPLPGKFGSVDLDNVSALAEVVATSIGADVTGEQAVKWFDNSFADAVVGDDGAVIWPAR
ncbi:MULTISPECIES: ABC transporter substrate-binding protein [Aeromicrobium]|uniref:Thiamine biosynthesis protein n=1 Tax=Aeromicrobium yanjiei TaxID=2662028 RepID=A0A5Q2ML11_9ACTN|nr:MULTISPECIES: ABC transporter substrate-binding protein [Aeromicrobium]MRK02245.1 thiamine biosynthesis protein [Aeromicrobium sp. S22]QGG41035.1 thiamine biosynthesis protein [Aeromicrobium yanjiei]